MITPYRKALGACLALISLNLTQAAEAHSLHSHTAETEWLSPRIVNDGGTPLAESQVMVGYAPGNPFEGNLLTSDEEGWLPFTPQWKTPLPLTIEAPGYVRRTYLDVLPEGQDHASSEAAGEHKLEVKGKTTEFGRLRRDGKVDFGLVIPAIPRDSLLQFDVSMVISPEVDRINVGVSGLDIPSNVTLPRQRENYIIPLTLEKPSYRTYLRKPDNYKFVATHGQFPIKKVVDDLRAGKSIFEVINFFTFIGGGLHPVQVDTSVEKQDIAVNQYQFDDKMSLLAPEYPESKTMISLGLWEENNLLMPSDLKVVASSESLELNTIKAQNQRYVLSILRENSSADLRSARGADPSVFHLQNLLSDTLLSKGRPKTDESSSGQLSFVLHQPSATHSPQFLDFVPAPIVEDNRIQLTPPRSLTGVEVLGTLVTLSEVETIKNGDVKSERRTRLWEVYDPTWIRVLDLPQMEWEHREDRSYRWEVIYLGRGATNSKKGKGLNEGLQTEEITHATRNSVEI